MTTQFVQKAVRTVRQHGDGLLALGLCGLALLIGPTLYANWGLKSHRHDAGQRSIPNKDIAIVLGAGVKPDGTPTEYLRNRLETAFDLYASGKVKKLLVSGDNSSNKYNEPIAMRRYLLKLGMPEQAIVVDYAGFNTYDTCYRAAVIFGVEDALVVTQGYHLPRAVWTCRGLGIDAEGVAAKKQGRDFTVTYIMREYASTAKAAFQLMLKPKPTVL